MCMCYVQQLIFDKIQQEQTPQPFFQYIPGPTMRFWTSDLGAHSGCSFTCNALFPLDFILKLLCVNFKIYYIYSKYTKTFLLCAI